MKLTGAIVFGLFLLLFIATLFSLRSRWRSPIYWVGVNCSILLLVLFVIQFMEGVDFGWLTHPLVAMAAFAATVQLGNSGSVAKK